MKHIIQKIILSVLLSLISILFIWSTANLPNRSKNGFERKFIENYVSLHNNFDLPKNSISLIGLIKEELFISTNTLNTFYKVKEGSKVYETIYLPFKPTISSNGYSIFVNKDSLLFFKKSGSPHFGYHLHSKQPIEFMRPFPNFIYALINKDSVIVTQEYSLQNDEKHFFVYNRYNGEVISYNRYDKKLYVLNKAISTDGQLLYDHQLNLFVYMHYYQNNFLTINTSSGQVDRYQTIDTVTNSLLGLKDQSLLVTNQNGAVHNGELFLSSNLKADNESYKDYNKHIPIDIYDIKNGRYKGSISLPLYQKSLIKSMISLNTSQLAVLYHNNRLSIFNINRK